MFKRRQLSTPCERWLDLAEGGRSIVLLTRLGDERAAATLSVDSDRQRITVKRMLQPDNILQIWMKQIQSIHPLKEIVLEDSEMCRGVAVLYTEDDANLKNVRTLCFLEACLDARQQCMEALSMVSTDKYKLADDYML